MDKEKLLFCLQRGHTDWLILIQEEESCDYTIGCGISLVPLLGSNLEDEAERCILDHGLDVSDRDHPVRYAFIIKGGKLMKIDMEGWRIDAISRKKAQNHEEQLKEERAEYERLKKKFAPKI